MNRGTQDRGADGRGFRRIRIPLGEPTALCRRFGQFAQADESVIVGYYTSAEVHPH